MHQTAGDDLPSKPKQDNNLRTLIARYGLGSFLENTQDLALLLNSRFKVLSGNAAFDDLRPDQAEEAGFKGFLQPAALAEFNRLSSAAKHTRKTSQGVLALSLDELHHGQYHCLFIPLEGGRLLFFAEPLSDDPVLRGKYRQVVEKLEQVQDELRKTRHDLELRQTEVMAVKAQAEEVSHIDSLTYLPNRKQIIADLQREVNSSERYGTPLSVSMLDLDHFKLVNDTYGHPTGDEVLRFVASQLREHIRLPDMIGRYGGEEFLVILPNSTVKAASDQAARLCRHVRSTPILTSKETIRITVSIGIAQYRIHGDDWRKLIDRADQAMYQAKNHGRDQWAIMW